MSADYEGLLSEEECQVRIWPSMGGPQEKNWTRWAAFRHFADEPEDEQAVEPETMAALAVMAGLKKSVPRSEVLEHVERAMAFCRVGLKAIPKAHWGPKKAGKK